MSEPRLDFGLFIACYGEKQILVDSVRQITGVPDGSRWSWELIFVDDGGGDKTRDVIGCRPP